MACLDTTLLLDLVGRGGRVHQSRAREAVSALVSRGEPICTTRLNVAELWTGVFRSDEPARERARVDRVLADCQVLELDAAGAETFGRITAQLQAIGHPVGDMDVLIAAVAIASGQRLITRNPQHFSLIPGLIVETY